MQLQAQLHVKEDRIMEVIIMSRNKNWSDLTAREKAPFMVQGIVQVTLLAAALADIHRRPAEEINGSKWLWSAVALVNFMGIGPIALISSSDAIEPKTPFGLETSVLAEWPATAIAELEEGEAKG